MSHQYSIQWYMKYSDNVLYINNSSMYKFDFFALFAKEWFQERPMQLACKGDTFIVGHLAHILSVGTLWNPKQQHDIKTSFDPYMSLFKDKQFFWPNYHLFMEYSYFWPNCQFFMKYSYQSLCHIWPSVRTTAIENALILLLFIS